MKEFLEDIENIKKLGNNDPEMRHGMEDGLMIDFIQEIADAGGTYSLKAKLLLELVEEPVSRWYA